MVINNLKKTNTVLIFIFLIIAGLYVGASFFIPITFGIFFATLVLPVCNYLERKAGLGRILSSFISTILLMVGVGVVFFSLIQQLGIFTTDLVERKDEIQDYLVFIRSEIMESTGFTLEQQEEMFRDRLSQILQFTQKFVSGILTGVLGMVLKFLLILIYVFLFLINRDKFKKFILEYVDQDQKEEANVILYDTKKVAHKYLWGRIQVMLILGVMYLITFTAFGLEHTALLVIFGVIVTIIPYVGPFISGLLPILFMIVFGGTTTEIIIFSIIVLIIQLIESYVLEPLIIGAEVKQSPLFIIIAIILGGAIWGTAGLILFVPIFGIMKIIFDHTKGLKPLGHLIGYEREGSDAKAGEGIFTQIKKKFQK